MAGVEKLKNQSETCENCKNFLIQNCVPYSLVTRHDSRTQPVSRHYWKSVIFILALLQVTEAYVTVSMNSLCKHTGTQTLRLSPATGTSLILEASNNFQQPCKMELTAPDTHSISLLFTRRIKKHHQAAKTAEISFSEESKTTRCPLTVSFPLLRPEDEVRMVLDLCSEDAFKTVEQHTDLLPPQVTLEWTPTVNNTDDILASDIVLAAVGRGREICSQAEQYPCGNTRYPIYCIAKDLVCDGKRNCPFEGSDEDGELCSNGGHLGKADIGKPPAENSPSQKWEFLASEFLKRLNSKEPISLKKSNSSSSTEKSTVLWSDEGNSDNNTESLPDVLNHYGPWGYLMLGMLICGTVLMFCGLWECCCRRPKAPVSTSAGPTLLIINQGAQQNELETPQTPGPPRYEDLDQPPSYAALFPSSKPPDIRSETNNSTTNTLPITIPIVDALNLLTNSTSSQTNSSTNSSNHQENRSVSSNNNNNNNHPVGSSGAPPDVFTLESNYLEIQRNVSDSCSLNLK